MTRLYNVITCFKHVTCIRHMATFPFRNIDIHVTITDSSTINQAAMFVSLNSGVPVYCSLIVSVPNVTCKNVFSFSAGFVS